MNNGSRRPLADRFFDKIEFELNTGCWLWSAYPDRKGYGRLLIRKPMPPQLAHRVSWEIHYGPIGLDDTGKPLCVLNKCDTPSCVNPAYLFLGTIAENNADMARKGRHGYRKFAALDEDQVREARRRCAAGETRASVAASMGVCRETIGHLARGKTWRHL